MKLRSNFSYACESESFRWCLTDRCNSRLRRTIHDLNYIHRIHPKYRYHVAEETRGIVIQLSRYQFRMRQKPGYDLSSHRLWRLPPNSYVTQEGTFHSETEDKLRDAFVKTRVMLVNLRPKYEIKMFLCVYLASIFFFFF
jgi:hypothetical protein